MFKFFRKIRQNLLSENKVRKYLAYAIGEIILVVIGILIALAINNSNQRRIIRDKEHTYLLGLQDEFRTSQKKLQELIRVNKQNYEGAKQIIGYLAEGSETPTEQQFSELLFNTFAFDVSFNPNNSLLNEMIHSGSLKDIRNADLRIRLTNWISTLEDIAKQEYELGVQREQVLDLFRTNAYSLRTVFDLTGVSSQALGLAPRPNHHSNLPLLESMEFENHILMFMLTSHATENAHYTPLMQDLNAIIDLLEDEIAE